MSINEERMLILKMLEDKKITSEEAAKLLAALSETESSYQEAQGPKKGPKAQNGFADEAAKVRDRVNDWKKNFQQSYNQKDFDNMIDDFANKAEKFGKNVAATTFGVVDKVIDYVGSFVDTNSFNIFGSYQPVTKTYEAIPQEGTNLEIYGVNGNVSIKKHLEPKVIIVTRIKSPNPNGEGIVLFENNPETIAVRLSTSTAFNSSVSHEIFVPESKFGSIKIENSNGKIYVEDAVATELSASTKNAHIELMGVHADKIFADTKNAKIQLSYIIGEKIDINTSNAVVDVKHIKACEINAITINGRINIENAQNIDCNTLNLYLKTSNGGIKVNMNDMENRAYKVKARASNGNINLLIPEILYHNIDRKGPAGSFVEAESKDFETAENKVTISAETVNGQIEVVK